MNFSISQLLLIFAQSIELSIATVPINEFDYIIVGGGTAGLAISTRLSQRLPNSQILVIEAGPSGISDLGINVPGKKTSTFGSKYDWNLTTISQPHLHNRVIGHPRGHVLGGSSAINLLTYDRASKHEYDGWVELGNPGWGWKEFSKMMDRAMNFTSRGTEWYSGAAVSATGPVRGTINRFIPAFQAAWIPVLNSLGVKTNKDFMGGNPLGASYQSSSIDPTHYNRSYSANAYLPLAGPNLSVMTEMRVAKVNMTSDHGKYRAIGVTLLDGTFIAAKQEVILSAGSFHSPGLLELSGIGKKSILETAGIKQLIDLPGVGENLQDHIRVQTSYQLKDTYVSTDAFRYNATLATEQMNLWIDNKMSLYDYTGSAYTFQTWQSAIGNDASIIALANAAINVSSAPAQRKMLEWITNPTIPQLEVIFSDGYTGIKGYPAVNTTLYGKKFFTLIAGVMHPLSRGSVHINASSPLGKPVINPNYLSTEHDVQAAIAGVKYCRKLALTQPLRDVWVSEYEPGLDRANTDAEWRDFVLNTTASIYHPVGTCAMLPRKDEGVVDRNLKVYGTSNLRIVDASIMPVLISAHIQTAVYGIAEMAADIVVAAAKN